jgi:uncharacterized membrane protein YraQ (UPF0718 family)/copper chaperone CopZ
MEILHEYSHHAWHVFQDLAPWLLLGVGVAGLLHILLPTDFVRRHLGRGNMRNVVKAALFGVPMPLCSCGVIPAAIGLKKDGASDGAAVAFLISTPQTGVDSITVSAVFLGLPFALFKVVTAFLTGLLGGALTNFTEPKAGVPIAPSSAQAHQPCHGVTQCAAAWYEFAVNDLLYSIWKWIVVGTLVSAAISTFVPQNWLAGQPWADGLAGMVLMLLISMPFYVCATASVPIAASLVVAGMPLGAALVFLMAGPATNAATLGAVFKEFGRRVTIIYTAVIAVGSILFGWIFDLMLGDYLQPAPAGTHASSSFGIVGAVVLLALFSWFAVRDVRRGLRRKAAPHVAGEEVVTLTVGGMTCEGCARNVKNALSVQHGVHRVEVVLADHRAVVCGHNLREEELREAVREAGYECEPPAGTNSGDPSV